VHRTEFASATTVAAVSSSRAAAAAQSSGSPAALSAATIASGEHASWPVGVPVVHWIRVAHFVIRMRLVRIGRVRDQFRCFFGYLQLVRWLFGDRTTCALQL
jgi:hypothetical protein